MATKTLFSIICTIFAAAITFAANTGLIPEWAVYPMFFATSLLVIHILERLWKCECADGGE